MNNLTIVRETFENVIVEEHGCNGGVQYIFRFENNYGASVVRHYFSYGHEQGLWELAVVRFYDDSMRFDIDYDTPITDDVLGYLNEEEICNVLRQIKEL